MVRLSQSHCVYVTVTWAVYFLCVRAVAVCWDKSFCKNHRQRKPITNDWISYIFVEQAHTHTHTQMRAREGRRHTTNIHRRVEWARARNTLLQQKKKLSQCSIGGQYHSDDIVVLIQSQRLSSVWIHLPFRSIHIHVMRDFFLSLSLCLYSVVCYSVVFNRFVCISVLIAPVSVVQLLREDVQSGAVVHQNTNISTVKCLCYRPAVQIFLKTK